MNLGPEPSWAGAGLAREVPRPWVPQMQLKLGHCFHWLIQVNSSLRRGFRMGHRWPLGGAKAGRPSVWPHQEFRDPGVGGTLPEYGHQAGIWGFCLFALGFSGPQEVQEGSRNDLPPSILICIPSSYPPHLTSLSSLSSLPFSPVLYTFPSHPRSPWAIVIYSVCIWVFGGVLARCVLLFCVPCCACVHACFQCSQVLLWLVGFQILRMPMPMPMLCVPWMTRRF